MEPGCWLCVVTDLEDAKVASGKINYFLRTTEETGLSSGRRKFQSSRGGIVLTLRLLSSSTIEEPIIITITINIAIIITLAVWQCDVSSSCI